MYINHIKQISMIFIIGARIFIGISTNTNCYKLLIETFLH